MFLFVVAGYALLFTDRRSRAPYPKREQGHLLSNPFWDIAWKSMEGNCSNYCAFQLACNWRRNSSWIKNFFCSFRTKKLEYLDQTTELDWKSYIDTENLTFGIENLSQPSRDQTVGGHILSVISRTIAIHAMPFIRNVVKICLVLILSFCIVVSYFRGHILASCF